MREQRQRGETSARCSLEARLSHKSRALYESPTTPRTEGRLPRLSVKSTSATRSHRQAVGESDNKRPSSQTYATASGRKRQCGASVAAVACCGAFVKTEWRATLVGVATPQADALLDSDPGDDQRGNRVEDCQACPGTD